MSGDTFFRNLKTFFIIALASISVALSLQNIRLKKSLRDIHDGKAPLHEQQQFNVKMNSAFFLKKFPVQLTPSSMLTFYDGAPPSEFNNGYLIIVFDTTVCGKCLHEGLLELKKAKQALEMKNIQIIGVAGVNRKSDEAQIIHFQKLGEAEFPFLIVKDDEIYDLFKMDKRRYLDTPFYVYTENNQKILSVFKPKQYETTELRQWITIFTRQDI